MSSEKLSEFDIYQMPKALGKYGEARVAEELISQGWTVFEPAYCLDSYFDLVASIKKCEDCKKFSNTNDNKCKNCNSKKLIKIYRTIQVKTSLFEKGGEDNSFAWNFRPKDLLTNPNHFLVGVVFDRKGEEHICCFTPTQFAEFADGGTHLTNHTWKIGRGRFHPHTGCLDEPQTNTSIPAKYINNIQVLKEDPPSVKNLLNKHEGWNRRTNDYSNGLWSEGTGKEKIQQQRIIENKEFLKKLLVGELEEIVNRKTSMLSIIKDRKILHNKPTSNKLHSKGVTHFSKNLETKVFLELQRGYQVFKNVKAEEYLSLKICCAKCKTIWDREEKECYKCKTWQPPLKKCPNNPKHIFANDIKGTCPECLKLGAKVKFRDICIKCGYEVYNGATDQKSHMNSTYFTPITFCQKCGKREIGFEFQELK